MMKKVSTIILALLIGSNLIAQSNSIAWLDSLSHIFSKKPYPIDNLTSTRKLKFAGNTFDTIAIKPTIDDKAYIIANAKYSIKVIQDKFSKHSFDYRQYLERDKEEEKLIATTSNYFVNGKIYPDGFQDTLYELYALKDDTIISVKVDAETDYSYSPSRKYKIYITTKN